jgi:hypothetical protein
VDERDGGRSSESPEGEFQIIEQHRFQVYYP